MRLDELGQTFVVRLVVRLKGKDGHRTHYPSRQIIFRCASFKMIFSIGFRKLFGIRLCCVFCWRLGVWR